MVVVEMLASEKAGEEKLGEERLRLSAIVDVCGTYVYVLPSMTSWGSMGCLAQLSLERSMCDKKEESPWSGRGDETTIRAGRRVYVFSYTRV